MYIYADFNGIEESSSDSSICYLNLTSYGTLASLSFYHIKLEDGQVLDFADPDGLLVSAEVFFDGTNASKNCSGWFAKFHKNKIIEIEPYSFDFSSHICFCCRENMKVYLDKIGRNFSENCPKCGTSVMFPLLPPTVKI